MQPMNENMFDMSPLHSQRTDGAPEKSVSFSGNKMVPGTATSGSAMSTDSMQGGAPVTARAPFGELQQNNFEFSKPAQQFGSTKAPFSMMNPAASTDSTRTPDQRTAREPVTPGSVVSESRNTSSADDAPKAPIVWSDVLLWKEPLQSLCLFTVGLIGFGILTFIFYGAHNMSFVSGLAYLLLLDVGTNFVRYFMSKPWHDRCLWGGASQMKHVLTQLNSTVLHLAAAHDKYLSAVDPFITLKVASALWALAWVGSYLSLWWCALLAYIGAFTVPAFYLVTKDSIAATAKSIRAASIDKIDEAGLPRTARFVFVASCVAVLYFFTNWVQFTIGFFVAATYWRTLLVPREIENIRTFAEPYTQSVHKVGRRISTFTEDTFARLSTAGPATRTKSHFRTE